MEEVYKTPADFDSYLWKTMESDMNGCLETWCIYDNGEDNSSRFGSFPNGWSFDHPPSDEAAAALTAEQLKIHCKENDTTGISSMTVPIESMDVISYSFSCRTVLSLISLELENGEAEVWAKKACYDRDTPGNSWGGPPQAANLIILMSRFGMIMNTK